jgi:uncharacterized membrane protein
MQRSAVWWCLLLLAATLPAFWPSYLAAPPFQADFLHVHLHGIVMFAWMALLLVQAALIRAGKRPLHRTLGKVSYVLAPLIVISTLLLAHYRLRQGPPNAELLYFFCVQLGLVAALAFSYVMAIRHKRQPALHMRYMMGTALAVVDPILARILAIYLGVTPPLMQVVTYALVLGVLAYLWWRERPAPHARAWAAMLAVFALALLPTFFLPQTAAWREFAEAFARLPLP